MRADPTAILCLAALSAIGCSGGGPARPPARRPSPPARTVEASDEAPPAGRLPAGVRPTRYGLELVVAPDRPRFSGTATIEVTLDAPRQLIWLHGRGLRVTEAIVAGVPARWDAVDPEGVAALRLDRPVGPGAVTIRLAFDAPFDEQLRGLYKVVNRGEAYAFTQFESIYARRAFPCFDEPAFKTPFDLTLVIPRDDVAVANTAIVEEASAAGGMKRVRFATTERLPTYLVAWAVGPLDVVDAPPIPPNAVRRRPLPLRGVATRGRGGELGYGLAEAARAIGALEEWFGIEYPYGKLDLIAVPDFAFGAMENAGAVTFREAGLLLRAETASEGQRRYLEAVLAHELAHQWFGNLVTMQWWDDIWLNEAFATWMEGHVTQTLHPEHDSRTEDLHWTHEIMRKDALASARRVHQPIASRDDIATAFDWITYAKGAAVIGMFERWLGAQTFQRGIRRYLEAHRWGNATSEDLLATLSEVSGRDVATPFRTFIEQAGVPLVEATVSCADRPALGLRQRPYLPVGSNADAARTWQIPVCARYETSGQVRESCTLLEGGEGRLELDGDRCPAWVLPNPDGAGYYRWSLPADRTSALATTAWRKLTSREQLSFAASLQAAFEAATTPAADVFAALPALARDDDRLVATAPMELMAFARDHLADERSRASVEAFASRTYRPLLDRLGWERRAAPENGESMLLREAAIHFLALVARDPAVRREAARRGRAYAGYPSRGGLDPSAVAADLAAVALGVAMQEGDAAFFDALVALLEGAQDATVRERILFALGNARDPALARRAADLSLDPRLKVSEVMSTIEAQMARPETREAAWSWVEEHYDALVGRLGPDAAAHELPSLVDRFCDAEHARDARAFFEPRLASLPGSPRIFANALERVELCVARVQAQGESARGFFARARP
ncbi:MAG: ERAP1-like C-terminal domain-containing protein [Deltaproteobacteria bacterium]|nr:ERAP1-like C-terminal domain-containing protein [Deltaproteobacteria bacterium]